MSNREQSNNRLTQISKTCTYYLRHGAEEVGLKLDPEGFVDVNQLLQQKNLKSKNVKFQELEEIVEKDEKTRFSLKKSPEGQWKIRANQGHTIKSAMDIPMEKVMQVNHPVVHGTWLNVWPKIKIEGLKRFKRNHIHFATNDKVEQEKGRSGLRKGFEILIYVDLEKAVGDGVVFYRSENDVILTEGINGTLPPKYFLKVWDKKRNIFLDF